MPPYPIAADVVKAIEEAADLDTLILSGNTCGVEACKAIGTALNTKLTFKVHFTITNITSYFSYYPESNMERYIYWQTFR